MSMTTATPALAEVDPVALVGERIASKYLDAWDAAIAPRACWWSQVLVSPSAVRVVAGDWFDEIVANAKELYYRRKLVNFLHRVNDPLEFGGWRFRIGVDTELVHEFIGEN